VACATGVAAFSSTGNGTILPHRASIRSITSVSPDHLVVTTLVPPTFVSSEAERPSTTAFVYPKARETSSGLAQVTQ
jgi:hypothetical protein